jgi:hypothetical protein
MRGREERGGGAVWAGLRSMRRLEVGEGGGGAIKSRLKEQEKSEQSLGLIAGEAEVENKCQETCCRGKRDLVWSKRDLAQCQKRPSSVSKETCCRGKRDLVWSKRLN